METETETGKIVYVYDKGGKIIYPRSRAEAITSNASNSESNVEADLKSLFDSVAELYDSSATISNIIIQIHYLPADTDKLSDIELSTRLWSDTFEPPTEENPYIWKRTKFTFSGADESKELTIYEIVASDVSTIILTIYTRTEGVTPVIEYKQKTDENGEPLKEYDYNYYWNGKPAGKLDSLPPTPEGLTYEWRDYPQDISLSFSSVFMSRRIRQGGEWKPFSTPAQYGQWPTTES